MSFRTIIPNLLLSVSLFTPFKAVAIDAKQVTANPWWQSGQQALQQRLALQHNNQPAKNVILFIGDGMGVSTVTAARIFDGQSRGESGEENTLSFEQFPHLALIKTYNTNQQVADSAGTATAIHSGVKTRAGVLGISEQARRANCREGLAHRVPVLGELAKQRKMAVGIVSTARVTHATPASVYAHSPERDWERDSKMPKAKIRAGCSDIAKQLVDFASANNSAIDVILGGGRVNFLPKTQGGKRSQGNLITHWQQSGGIYVDDKTALQSIPPTESAPLLGLFSNSHMTYMAEREADSNEPTLTDMTEAAIRKLGSHQQGYYLMVESGRIDHGHHEGVAGKALMETQEFARAINKAMAMVDLQDTLIMVTADHSHVFTIAGYPSRGNPILGIVRSNDENGEPTNKATMANDNKPFTTLAYANGPGAIAGKRSQPATGLHAVQQAAIPTGYKIGSAKIASETHGGEDVALYAIGPRSHVVGGVLEQQVIFHIISHALGWDLSHSEDNEK